jgi:hypothetical protein
MSAQSCHQQKVCVPLESGMSAPIIPYWCCESILTSISGRMVSNGRIHQIHRNKRYKMIPLIRIP